MLAAAAHEVVPEEQELGGERLAGIPAWVHYCLHVRKYCTLRKIVCDLRHGTPRRAAPPRAPRRAWGRARWLACRPCTASSSSGAASGPAGRPAPSRRAGRDHARRPAQLPPLPAARLPGRHGRALARRGRLAAARALQGRRQRARVSARRASSTSARARSRSAPTVEGHEPMTLGYDTLIVAGGASYSYFGARGVERAIAPEVKSLEARARTRRILGPSRRPSSSRTPSAARAADLRRRGRGADRRQMAGRSARSRATRCAATSGRSTPRRADRARERADASLTAFPTSSRQAADALRALGVTPLTGHAVLDDRADGVTVQADGGPSAFTRAPSSGRPASRVALAAARGAAGMRPTRRTVTVEPDLTLPGHPEVIALGDWCG